MSREKLFLLLMAEPLPARVPGPCPQPCLQPPSSARPPPVTASLSTSFPPQQVGASQRPGHSYLKK